MYNVTTVRLQRKLPVAFYNGRKVNHLLCFNCFNGYIELLGELGIIDPLVKKFGSFRELKKYAKVAPDPELLGKIKVCTPRVVTKISSCQVNTTSRWGKKQLGVSFGSIFLLFSFESSRGPRYRSRRKSPAPAP